MGIFGSFIPGFKQNWKVVFLSVFGAATFWFFHAMNKDYETRIDYPVEFLFNRDSVVIVHPLEKSIKIDVASGGWMLIRKTLRFNANPIQIPLENPTDIKYLTRSSLTPIITEQLEGLQVKYVVTDTIFFNIEQRVSKRVLIAVDSFNIPLHENYNITSKILIKNDSITVSGPKSVIEDIVEPVLVNFEQIDIEHSVDEELGYQLESMVVAEPATTSVKFKVSRFLLKQVSIPIEFLNFPRDSSAVPARKEIQIFFTINENFMDDVKAGDFKVTADFKKINRRDSTIVPVLEFGHEKATDIVLAFDKLKVDIVRK